MKIKKIISMLLSIVMLMSTVGFSLSANATTTSGSPSIEISKSEKTPIAELSSFKAYDDYIEKLMDNADIDGVTYVVQNDLVLASHTRGMQNTKENKRITVDTQFPIGSISKQFCATAILLLQEQGKLSVNDTLSKYFPTYEIGKDITIHNLLSMRSGIRDHVNSDDTYVGHEYPTLEYTLSQTATHTENQKIITDWLFTQELKFAPDAEHDYSNANFLLLSMIVEQVSGIKYSDFVKENIFAPLNMTNSGFYEELYKTENIAEDNFEEGVLPMEPFHKGMSQGSGDLVSNAPDINIWLNSLSDRTLLSEESYNAMTTDYGSHYGYGILVDPINKGIYHQGNIATYESFAITIPEKNLNIFVVTNDVNPVYENGYTMNQFGFSVLGKINTKTVLGDVDGDKEISILDATGIQLHIAQIKPLTAKQLKGGDTDGDGEVSILDATEIQLFLAQM